MRKPSTPRIARPWAWLWAVVLGYLLPVGLAWGQGSPPPLLRSVRLAPGTRPLSEVLAELSRQAQLPFSYSSSLVPVSHPCILRPGPARPLNVVLREVLAAEHLSYGLVEGQLVLWPAHLAPPAGVTSVNGRAVPSRTAAVASSATGAPQPAVADARSAGSPAVTSGVKPRTGTSPPTRTATLSSKAWLRAKRVAPGGQAGGSVARPYPESKSPRRATPGSPPTRSVASISANAGNRKPLKPNHITPAPHRGQPREQAAEQGGRRTPSRVAASSSPRQIRVGWGLSSLATIPALPVSVKSLPEPSGMPTVSQPAAAGTVAPTPARVSKSVPAADSGAEQSHTRTSWLHGQVWASECLPLNVAVQIGPPRIYALVGAAAGPREYRSSWALGAGAGTSGRSWGRFTPSLEVLQWLLVNEREDPQGWLTQLRPLVSWQVKQGRRGQLVGGPTLNLAAAPRERGRTRWALGQDQWLWLNVADRGQPRLRLWPGVQLGLRF
ncbi:hypothetical protein [Hymenobacter sp. BT491]|uniref:hypothetical protein n=1 Tax=Hymenobacter sp. BT491 TaxID=2766779 RepID=UPI001653C4E7|nr:hypothetical protein [Hymenobacter sp. BT491]MBC6992528.1 hypothetical protein [Hymenobacter sp. BT491]